MGPSSLPLSQYDLSAEGKLEEPSFYLLKSAVNAKQESVFPPGRGQGTLFLSVEWGKLGDLHMYALSHYSQCFLPCCPGLWTRNWEMGSSPCRMVFVAMDCLGHKLCDLE